MKVLETLVNTPPRETAGSRSANRFGFQSSWALVHLLELHLAEADYRVLFDFHDDILVLDSAHAPTKVAFFQIKTHPRPWTVAALTKKEKHKTEVPLSSPLAKLLGDVAICGDATESLNFVSNAQFDIRLGDGNRATELASIRLDQLHPDEIHELKARLSSECSEEQIAGLEYLILRVTPLSRHDHATSSLGSVTNVLAEWSPGTTLSPTVLHRVLRDEIERRSTCELRSVSLEGLCLQKSICRGDFEKILHELRPVDRLRQVFVIAMQRLTSESMSFRETHKLAAAWAQIEADYCDVPPRWLIEARVAIRTMIDVGVSEAGTLPATLSDTLAWLTASPDARLAAAKTVRSAEYLKALALLELYSNA